MKPYGQGPPHSTDGSQSGWNSPAPPETGVEESMWQLGLGGGGSGRENSYPERPSEADCVYYMRTGFCGYGARCRFNHPRDRSSVSGVVRTGGELPERVGQPVCQYFLRTGTCKYGASCKYHHPRYGGESESPVALNFYGYPLRPDEKECSYYVKTGQCKFGVTCKFHHPLPAGISVPATAPTFYPTVQPASVPPQYGIASWQVARPPVVPSSYVQGPYGPVLLPPGMVQVPGWSPFPPIVSPVASPGTQHATGTSSLYGSTHQLSPSAPAYVGPISSSSFAAGPSSSSQKEHIFPQRPGQPECQFYMRTGDCKYGSSCRYHHPPEWSMPKITCALSPLGLPLRPGTPICTFYAQHGVCKFGLTCKFDHPMETPSYSPSASSLADMPVVPYTVGSSMVTLVPSTSSSELRPEFAAGSSKDSYPVKKTSLENMPSISVGTILSKGSGSVPQSRIQLSTQSSSTSSGSRSFGRGGVSS